MYKSIIVLVISVVVFVSLSNAGCNKQVIEIPIEESTDPEMPLASDLLINYPQYGSHLPGGGMSDQEFANTVGGFVKINLDAGHFGNNTCALRLSHAINLSGHSIPYIEDETSSGSQGYKYIYRVKTMKEYLTEVFGEPTIVSTNQADFIGHIGIILFETGDLWDDATGHSTVFNGTRVMGGNYAGIPGYYFEHAQNIMLWEGS